MIAKGSSNLSKIYLGNTEITKAYLGTEQIYPNEVPFTTSNLTFTTNTNLQDVGNVISATTGGGYGHTGLDVLNVAAGQAARIYWQYKSADGDFGILGFNTVNAQTGYAGMELAVQINTGAVLFAQNGSFFATSVTLNNNDWVGIFICGGVAKLQRSVDGTTWTDFLEYRGYFTNQYPQQIYIVCDIHGSGKMYFPKVDLYGAGIVSKTYLVTGNSLMIGLLDGSNLSTSNIAQQAWIALDSANDYTYANKALGANTISQNITTFTTSIVPLLSANYGTIIMAELEGTNTLIAKTGAQTFADMQTYIDTVLNQDPRIKLMVYMTPSANTVYFADAQRVIYNDLLATLIGTNSRLKIVDIRSAPELNNALAWQDLTYYQADGVHLTQAGYNILGALGVTVALSF